MNGVLHEKVIHVFHEKYYIPKIEKLSFHLAHVRILCSMEFGNTRNDFSTVMHEQIYKVKRYDAEKFSESTVT